ncbi:carbohydrate kinase family protein [Candidatus Pacearchaeota archaeon]|nr:carbohydrate kinase family protein [Candidatus Pacearchaeota archaeon]
MFDVITFGSAVVDTFVDTDVSEKKKFISYPVGSKILIKNLRFDVGGGGTNTAVAFSRLGLKTGYIGEVGFDSNGDRILNLLKKEKIKFLGSRSNDGPSGYSVVLDSKEKSRTILTYKGINDHIDLKDIQLKKVKTKWLYYSSMLGQSFGTQVQLAKILTKKGVKLAINPSEYLITQKNLKPLLKMATVLVLNKEEAVLLIGKKSKDLLADLHKLGPDVVVITDKDNPIQAFDGKRKYFLKPNKVRVVERTGAGDAFASGFVAGMILGWSIDKCLKFGLKEGESVLRYIGAKNKLLTMKLK